MENNNNNNNIDNNNDNNVGTQTEIKVKKPLSEAQRRASRAFYDKHKIPKNINRKTENTPKSNMKRTNKKL